MARTHGFRVFIVETFANRKAGNDPLAAGQGSSVASRVVALLEQANRRGTVFSQPRPVAVGEPPRSVMSTTVGEPHVFGPHFVHVRVEIGETGSHTRATQPNAPALDLTGRSPEVGHFVTFLFSREEDESRFIVVTESVRGRDPLKRLASFLTKLDSENKKAHRESQQEAARVARASGQPRPETVKYNRLLFEAVQAVDNEYLGEILSSAKSVSAVFKSYGASPRGGARPVIERKLSIELRGPRGQQIGQDTARRWWNLIRNDSAATRHEGVSELAAVLEDADLLDEDEGARYEDAAINVTDQAGERTTVAVDTLRDVFTYPVSDGAPPAVYYYERVAPRVRTIARDRGIALDRIDVTEVQEWQDVSTSAPSSGD